MMRMKHYLLALGTLAATPAAFAQSQSHEGHNHLPGEPCAAHIVLQEQLKDPEVRARYEAYEEALLRYVNDPSTPKYREGRKFIIPTVVHILQSGGNENITKQKALQQIQTLNEDFKRLNPDSVNTPERFRDVAGRMDVEFRLATKDPLGNCTDGIVRIFTDNTNDVRDPTGFKALSYWNSFSYLNIWVVQSIASFGTAGTVLGYAQFPATGLMSTDGITVIASQMGRPSDGGRTGTHEVGHWLNLIHVWGDQDCGTDQVDDTPIALGPNFNICGNVGQPLHTQPHRPGVCDPENTIGEMFPNYMDYTPGTCQNMFSAGQVQRMNAVMEGTGDQPGIRAFLVSEQNLEMTGTRDEDLGVECAPRSLFHVNQSGFFQRQTMICEGDNVGFRANAFNGNVNEYAWNFQGGSPATSSATNPTVSYDSPGRYDVALTVANNIGSDTRSMNDLVIVSPSTAQYQSDWGYFDTFWEEQGFLNDYIVFNHDDAIHTWEFHSGENGGSTGNESVRMRNFGNIVGRVDELISPSYNLSTVSNPTLKFRWSGAALNNSPNDRLRVYFSTNCGKSWTLRATLSGFDLVNSGVVSASYVPNTASIWSDAQVSLPPAAANAPNVRVKFEWRSGGNGNNFYIDDITLSNAPLSAESLEREIDLNIFPNPTSQSTTVAMMLADPARVEITMIDMMGRKVMDVFAGQMMSGPHRLEVDMSGLPVGIYFLRMAVENNIAVKKVVKN